MIVEHHSKLAMKRTGREDLLDRRSLMKGQELESIVDKFLMLCQKLMFHLDRFLQQRAVQLDSPWIEQRKKHLIYLLEHNYYVAIL